MRVILVSIIIIAFNTVYAKDFGVKGPVYPIIETSLLEHIYNKLNEFKANGKLKKLNQEFKENVEKSVITPVGIQLSPAVKHRVRLFDPSITLKNDIRTHDAKLIAKKGTKINPLSYVSLTKKLIFINANRAKEIEFAKGEIEKNTSSKIILINGNVKSANQAIQKAVYFDQEAKLVSRFGLEYTPSVIEQEGTRLKISEVVV